MACKNEVANVFFFILAGRHKGLSHCDDGCSLLRCPTVTLWWLEFFHSYLQRLIQLKKNNSNNNITEQQDLATNAMSVRLQPSLLGQPLLGQVSYLPMVSPPPHMIQQHVTQTRVPIGRILPGEFKSRMLWEPKRQQ